MNKSLASVIVLNLNGKSFLEECFFSLNAQTYKNFEIILVDNGSKDDSVLFVREKFSAVKIIVNDKNLGFAEANNQGFAISSGEYIVTLNNDTRVHERWLESLVAEADKDEKVGMVTSKILSMKMENQIDSTGVNVCLDGMTRGRGRLEQDNGQYDDKTEILFPSACAALYKRKMLDDIGFFDSFFFAYCEDSDLGIRGRLAGWKAVFAPKAVVYHYYSATGGKYSKFKAYLVERNHAYFVIKNFPIELIIAFPFLTAYRLLLQVFAALSGRGATAELVKDVSFFETVKVVFSAYWSVFISLPRLIKERAIIQKSKVIFRKEFYGLLSKHRLSFNEVVFKK